MENSFYSLYLMAPDRDNEEALNALRSRYVRGGILIIVIGVSIATVINFLMTKKLSGSILALKHTVQNVEEGNLKSRFEAKTEDEIGYLGRHFNEMMDSIEEFYQAREQNELAKKDLEIQLLQSQIDPHLIYNTFNSVAFAIRETDGEKAERLLFTLSDFLRASLSKGNVLIPLRTELESVSNYILLQQMVDHSETVLKIDVPPELKNALMIRTTLQPIVENSILHGISGYRNDGEIIIRARLSDDRQRLFLTVRDNGIGMDEEELTALNREINQKDFYRMGSHFGLYNVNWRLKYMWKNEACGITVDSEISDYTEVVIEIPYITERSDEVCGSM